MTAASYARYSTDKQRPESIDDQERKADRLCLDKLGVAIEIRYRDSAVSGWSKDRSEYSEMMRAARSGEFDVLILDDLSRLGRDQDERGLVIRRLEFSGVRIISADGYDSELPQQQRVITRSARGMIDSMYSIDLAEKTHRGLTGQALKGNNAGGRSYGYRHVAIEHPTRKDPHGRPEIESVRREVDEVEAEVIRWIFAAYASGRSSKAIAADLNRRRVPAPRGGTWSFSAIYGHNKKGTGILNNPLYVGLYIWNRSRWVKNPDTGRRHRVERPRSEWVETELPELRIVPQDLWDAVKERQAARAQTGKSPGRGPRYLFSGLLTCAECGSRFIMVNRYKYGCSGHRNRGAAFCSNSAMVSRKVAEDRLLEVIRDDLLHPDAIEAFRQEFARVMAGPKEDKTALRRELRQVEQEIENIARAIRAGVLTKTTREELEKAEAERDRLQAALRPKARQNATKIVPRLLDDYRADVEALSTSLREEDIPKARQQVAAILGDSIPLSRSTEGDYLEAEVTGDYTGILKLAGATKVVAGAGFCLSRTVPLRPR